MCDVVQEDLFRTTPLVFVVEDAKGGSGSRLHGAREESNSLRAWPLPRAGRLELVALMCENRFLLFSVGLRREEKEILLDFSVHQWIPLKDLRTEHHFQD